MATRNIVPRADKEGKLGTAEKKWAEVNADKVNASQLSAPELEAIQTELDTKAPIDSPTFTGTPTAPTPATDDNSTQVATTAYVQTQLNSKVTGPASAVSGNLPVFDGTTGKIIKDAGIALNPLISNVTLKVGAAETYHTIKEALEYAVKKYYPIFLSYWPHITIQLQAGFVMAEQVFIESLDLSWITITGVDDETVIARSALTKYFTGYGFIAFGAINGAFLPIIGQLFNMDDSGEAGTKHGIIVSSNSRAIILPNCGVKNAGDCSINVSYGSMVNANGANASGAGTNGINVSYGSMVNANGANASGAGTNGISVNYGSMVNANGATGTLSQTKNTLTSNGIIFQQ